MPVKITIDERQNSYVEPENNFDNSYLQNYTNKPVNKKTVDYDGILKNMGMREIKGKLFWEKNIPTSTSTSTSTTEENFVPYDPKLKTKTPQQMQRRPPLQQQHQQQQIPKNSYIHNKYFKNEIKDPQIINRPANREEYRNMLIRQFIEKKRIERIKTTKMTFER
jgi:hypothetical protein